MAARMAENIREDYLTCSICCETFNDPRVLDCGHSFCFECLQDYAKSKSRESSQFIYCPICRHTYTIDEREDASQWVESLSADTLSLSVLQAITTFVPLVRRESAPALEREVPLPTSASGLENLRTCTEHPDKKMDVFCSKHDAVICSECAWRYHKGNDCNCFSVAEVIEKRASAMKGLIHQQTRDADILLESTEPGVKSFPNLRTTVHETFSDIEQSFDVLCENFRKHIVDVRAKVDDAFENNDALQKLQFTREQLGNQLDKLEATKLSEEPNTTLQGMAILWSQASDFQRKLHELSRQTNIKSFSRELHYETTSLRRFIASGMKFITGEDRQITALGGSSEESDESSAEDGFVVVRDSFMIPREEPDRFSCSNHQEFVFSAKRPGETSCMLSGLALLGNAAVVVSDQMNRKLKKFKLPEGYFQDQVKLQAEPNQVAALKESSNIVVTIWDQRRIYVLSTDPCLQLKVSLATEVEYIGITCPAPNCIAASCIRKKRVDILKLDDVPDSDKQSVSTVKVAGLQTLHKSSFPDRIASTGEGHVVIRNRRRKEICCVNTDNTLLWSRRLPAPAMDIACVQGRLFATMGRRNEIVHFSENGLGRLEVLKVDKKLNHPWCVGGFKDCVVITEDSPSDQVHVFVFM